MIRLQKQTKTKYNAQNTSKQTNIHTTKTANTKSEHKNTNKQTSHKKLIKNT